MGFWECVGQGLLDLDGDGLVGLEGHDGVGRAGQFTSVIEKGRGDCCREGRDGLVG